MARYVVAAVDEIPPGGRKIVEIAGLSIGIFNLGGEFFALRNRCPHQGGPVCEGRTWGVLRARVPGQVEYSRAGELLTCPWHGWEYDIRTGQSWCDPARRRVRRYAVSVAPEDARADPAGPVPGRVPGPYIVETYPAAAEGRLIVVEL